MKYVNPEYVSILAESADVITLSIVSVPVVFEEKKNYTQTKDYHVNTETGDIEQVGTTISATLDALGLGM